MEVTVQVGLRIYYADCKKEYNRNGIGYLTFKRKRYELDL